MEGWDDGMYHHHILRQLFQIQSYVDGESRHLKLFEKSLIQKFYKLGVKKIIKRSRNKVVWVHSKMFIFLLFFKRKFIFIEFY